LLEIESNKEIFRKREYELFEQQCIRKKLMRTILATYPVVREEFMEVTTIESLY